MKFSTLVFAAIIQICTLQVYAQAKIQNKSIAVLNFKSTLLKDQDLVSLSNFTTTELSKYNEVKVIAWDDVKQMLEHSSAASAMGCDNEKCYQEIGGAMGVDYILAGDVGAIGDRYLINLKLIDIQNANTISRASDQLINSGLGIIVDKIPKLLPQILNPIIPNLSKNNTAFLNSQESKQLKMTQKEQAIALKEQARLLKSSKDSIGFLEKYRGFGFETSTNLGFTAPSDAVISQRVGLKFGHVLVGMSLGPLLYNWKFDLISPIVDIGYGFNKNEFHIAASTIVYTDNETDANLNDLGSILNPDRFQSESHQTWTTVYYQRDFGQVSDWSVKMGLSVVEHFEYRTYSATLKTKTTPERFFMVAFGFNYNWI